MKILKVVSNDEKRDIVKAGNAVTPFKDLKGEVVKMTGLVIGEKTEGDVDTGEETTKEDADFVVEQIKGIVARLRSMSPLYEDFMKKQNK